MKRKKAVAGRKLKKVASQRQGKKIYSFFSSARPGVKSVPQRMETPPDLSLPLMIVPMPSDHNILIPVEDDTFGLEAEYIYVCVCVCVCQRMMFSSFQ